MQKHWLPPGKKRRVVTETSDEEEEEEDKNSAEQDLVEILAEDPSPPPVVCRSRTYWSEKEQSILHAMLPNVISTEQTPLKSEIIAAFTDASGSPSSCRVLVLLLS